MFEVQVSAVQYSLHAQFLRPFSLHDDVNDAHRAGANRLQNKQTDSSLWFRSRLQDCLSLRNSLLNAIGLTAFLPSTPRYASFSRIWDVDAASNEFGSTLILLSGFSEAMGISPTI